MPELPEVETVVNGLKPHICGQKIQQVVVRTPKLRWDITPGLERRLADQEIVAIKRRGKYMLLSFGDPDTGTLLLHLGMSGSFCLVTADVVLKKHDHIDIRLKNSQVLRYNDPRRFGACLLVAGDPYQHVLLASLGPEPLSDEFSAIYLARHMRNKKRDIKSFIMDSKIVVGVGNIYAQEALFKAKIAPTRMVNTLTMPEIELLVTSIKTILQASITAGGTTFRDFVNSEGKPGYFAQNLYVYGRGRELCHVCNTTLALLRQGQRSTAWCPQCQI